MKIYKYYFFIYYIVNMLLTKIFHYIAATSVKFGIDESHSMLHSMNTLIHSTNILREEIKTKPNLKKQEKIIHTAALIHDMVDSKYVNTDAAVLRLRSHFRNDFTPTELDTIIKIVSTMSYRKVKKDGYPRLDEYQTAFHIVREADLLCSYDFDRAITYKIQKKFSFEDAYLDSCEFFNYRVLKIIDDDLFFHDYSKKTAQKLHNEAIERMWIWKKIYDLYKDDFGNNKKFYF